MKPTLTLIAALLLTPLTAFAQAKPEVANATQAAKRAWESAPLEKKALWQQHRCQSAFFSAGANSQARLAA